MTQRHVDLLMEAVNLEHPIKYLCYRIAIVSGYHCTNTFWYLRNVEYNDHDHEVLTSLIQNNIEENLRTRDDEVNTFDNTEFAYNGMTRKEWAEKILAPLFLAIEED